MGDVVAVSVYEPTTPATLADPRIRLMPLATAAENASSPRLARRRTGIDTRVSEISLARLNAVARDFQPDTIVVEGIPLFPLLAHVRALAPTIVLDMHNIESDLARQMLPKMGWLSTRFSKPGRRVRRMRDMELRSLRMVDKVWVCSVQDRERLARLCGGSVSADVVPNGIPRFDQIPHRLIDRPVMTNGQAVVLFVGHLNYPPNIDAATRLATQVMPRLRARLGDARLIIAGRDPNQRVLDLAGLPDVVLIPDQQDLAPLYRQAHVTIVPLDSGGGTRLKILEAMAWGLPVVATRLAAEGLGLVDGADIDFAVTEDELAANAAALCRDEELWQRRRTHARKTAVQRFGPDAIDAAVKKSLG